MCLISGGRMGCYHPGKRIFKVHVKQSQSFEIDKVLQVCCSWPQHSLSQRVHLSEGSRS